MSTDELICFVNKSLFYRFYDILFDASCSEVFSYNPCFPFDSPDKYTTTGAGNKPCIGASVKYISSVSIFKYIFLFIFFMNVDQ